MHTAYTMTHIITHNSKHTAHIITHTLTHKKDHNSIDTPQNNPQKRRANHFAVFVPQPFRAVDKLAVGESHEVHEVCAVILFALGKSNKKQAILLLYSCWT
ncbi:hypothetical protein SGP16026_44460 [Shigella flexneri]|nr:hypothetical protein SGP16026_44460 [Shigella flexneri]